MTVEPPWSGQQGWHRARWGPLGWFEAAAKLIAYGIAITTAVSRFLTLGSQAAFDGSAASVPDQHRLPFLLIATIAVGYVITVFDRWVDREIVSMVFVVFTVVGHWSLVATMALEPWPGTVVTIFAVLMMCGDMAKILYFVTTGARVRTLPRLVPVLMTAALVVVYAVVAITA